MKKILVTGGAGYIGSVLIPILLDKGFDVTVVDNFMYQEPSLAAHIHRKNLNLQIGDVRNQDLMKQLLTKNDVIIPLAAIVGAPACDRNPELASSVNKDSIFQLLANISPNQQVIMPTTNSAYGSGNKDNRCDENSSLNPISLYAKDKVEVEKALADHDFFTSFRLATVFGLSPRMRLDLLVNNFVYRAITDRYLILFEGHFKRNYIHVRDVAQAFLMAIENPDIFKNEVFNVGLSSANISKNDLCLKIQEVLKDFVFVENDIYKDPDQRNYIVSNDKIEELGFTPEYSLELGILEMVSGLRMYSRNQYTNL